MKLIENIGKLSTLDIEEATLGPLHPFPNWVLNHDLNDTVCYLTLNFGILFSKKTKMLSSSYSKNCKIVNFPMKFSFYRLDIEKLFRILDLLNKLYFGTGLNFKLV